MFVTFQGTLPSKQLAIIGPLIVVAVWVWVAVSTKQAVKLISSGTIPFSKRAIWLLKILALIVGGGGAIGLAQELGAPLLLAIVLGGVIVFFAVREDVQEVAPPRPVQDASSYQVAWQEYNRLREAYMRSLRWFGVGFLGLVAILGMTSISSDKLSESVRIGLFAAWFVAWIASIAVLTFNQWKLHRWPCPRCGRPFRGFWARAWLPKRCVYCGLERGERRPS